MRVRVRRDFFSAARIGLSLLTLASAAAQAPTYVASTYAGGGPANVDGPVESARLYFPMGLAVDREGDVYVADTGSRTVRRISSGVVTTLAGSTLDGAVRDGIGSAARLVGPDIIAVDQDRNVYVAAKSARILQRITPAGVVTTLAGGDALGGAATGIAVDSAKNVYATLEAPREVRRITPTGAATTLLGRTTGPIGTYDLDFLSSAPRGIAVGADDMVHVLTSVYRYKITPGGNVSRFGITGYFGFMQAAALDQMGNAYIAGLDYDAVSKVTPAGVLSVLATDANNRFGVLSGIAVDANGSVLVADSTANSIFQIAADGAVSKWLGSRYYRDGAAANALFEIPSYLATDGNGNVFLTAGGVRRIDAQRNVTSLQDSPPGFVARAEPSPPSAIASFSGLAADRAGNLYLGDWTNHVVHKISPAGTVTTLAGSTGTEGTADGLGASAQFTEPGRLAVDGNGNVFVGDRRTIRKITPAGQVTTLAGNSAAAPATLDGTGPAARFLSIGGLAVIDDTLYVADYATIRKITPAGVVTTIAGTAGDSAGITVDGQGPAARFRVLGGMTTDAANLYVADFGAVRKVTVDGAVTTLWQSPGLAVAGIAADPAGNIFVSIGVLGGRIHKLSPLPFPPNIEAQPRGQAVPAGASFSLTARAAGNPTPTIQWQQNGRMLDNANAEELSLPALQPAQSGIYRAVLTNAQGTNATTAVLVGLTTTNKVLGAGRELEPHDIRHPNGNVFDQVLLEGAAAAITADYSPDPTRNQVTRVSFVDFDDDIVQVELSGPGTLSVVLENASGPALPGNYQQDIAYMKGHAGLVIAGATERTHVSIFSVGRATAINQALFRPEVNYGGMADLAFLAISSANGRFGGLRAANANFYATRGLTGIYAPGVVFEGPVYVGNISAFDAASPVLQLGRGSDVRVTGGDLFQDNGRPVEVSGIARLQFTAGADSHAKNLPARANRAALVIEGRDVSAEIVVYP